MCLPDRSAFIGGIAVRRLIVSVHLQPYLRNENPQVADMVLVFAEDNIDSPDRRFPLLHRTFTALSIPSKAPFGPTRDVLFGRSESGRVSVALHPGQFAFDIGIILNVGSFGEVANIRRPRGLARLRHLLGLLSSTGMCIDPEAPVTLRLVSFPLPSLYIFAMQV
ncbi:hypothetical protein BDZ89DRAFT_804258 [Hymenopellis radicata]|nr:hypothetical protein BDZ89DRAFT_804258 [Hymenopellis radicata]